jgi:hypothetical protein
MLCNRKRWEYVDKSDPLEPALNKMIVESIHNNVMEPMAAKGKLVYDMTADEPDNHFKSIVLNVKVDDSTVALEGSQVQFRSL